MTLTTSHALTACIGTLFGMLIMLAVLPFFYVRGNVEINYRQTVFTPYGKNKGIGRFELVNKQADLEAVCSLHTMRVKCVVDLGGPQI